jgi:hypothetical protein
VWASVSTSGKKPEEAMGGEIWCRSAPGQGCTFVLTWPLVETNYARSSGSGEGSALLPFPKDRRFALPPATRVG